MKTQPPSSTPNNKNVSKAASESHEVQDQIEKNSAIEEFKLALAIEIEAGNVEVIEAVQPLINKVKILEADKLIMSADGLLKELATVDPQMEVEAVRGYLAMATQAIRGLSNCSHAARSLVASEHIEWPVMMELGGDKYLQVIEARLRSINLGSAADPQVSLDFLAKSPSRHKLIVSCLYLEVDAIRRGERLANAKENFPERRSSFMEDMGEGLDLLRQLVDGYAVTEWCDEHLREFGNAIKALRPYDVVNVDSFDLWFAACRTLLVCITKDGFHLEKHGLRRLGVSRVTSNGDDIHKESKSSYQSGILETLMSTLKRTLKITQN